MRELEETRREGVGTADVKVVVGGAAENGFYVVAAQFLLNNINV